MVSLFRKDKAGQPGESQAKSRKPKDTPFLQQRMKAWQPIFTNRTSIQTFLVLGLLFIPLGGFWLSTNEKVREVRFDYTKCDEIDLKDEFETMPEEYISKRFKASSAGQPVVQWKRTDRPITFDQVTNNYTLCTIDFFLPEELKPPVLFYYHLTNFNQNHRKYIASRHRGQLKGKDATLESIKDSCHPAETRLSVQDGQEKIIYPCGAIANSVFNDTFATPKRILDASGTGSSTQIISYNMSRAGIASAQDKSLYKPSSYLIPDTAGANDSIIVPPPNWAARYPRGYHRGNMFDPSEDEAFMIWMRTAASPSFAKLAMRNDDEPMKRGRYRLEMFSHFPIQKNGGKKTVIITSPSSGVGYNGFLGTAYMVTGSISLILAVLFAFSTAFRRPRDLKDHVYLHRS
ncbi:uncharacterized protein NECHADRAFT_53654 [Fusarium vanettenii 77-13-4]|uniref:Uncharacterized protein n=1 Tax=Fusarium vanettenii (strain ATCC MYA-4622 / CBS 123669 / FGSC 9596 / NRRL 45880 / 77-13-4) TaxID=660122 RepID=C7ZE46_FUSV7|nr:uncharacterized protein NECHADRAFT_53654 [Fusarium vanettenii 77-13-4]EEU37644.1 hypothetical protein NECHADRAFT_53654 [Fusarium vanettenii 77-13-4]